MWPQIGLGVYDHVTALPTRARFIRDHLGLARGPCDLVLVTLTEPRQYNEILRALGHDCADSFVRAGADLVGQVIGPEVELYHVSVLSLAFAVPQDAGATRRLVREVQMEFARPVRCHSIAIRTRIGIGIAPLPGDADPTEALRAALTAAQESRRRPDGVAEYDRGSDQAHQRAFRLLHDLEQALKGQGQLALHYQPRLDLATDTCPSAEALLRWTHPELGAISPAEFIPLAEATSLIAPLTDWVLHQGLAQMRAWADQGVGLDLSINVSPHNLHDPAFLPTLQQLLDQHRIAPARIEIEFTEGALVTHDSTIRQSMRVLRDLGIGIAIDDFGTGYSSLGYLIDLPASVVKLDKSFLRQLLAEPRTQVLVRAIVGIAHNLGLSIVAEGVESQAVLDRLRSYGYDQIQGYFLSRPLPADGVIPWLTDFAGRGRAARTMAS